MSKARTRRFPDWMKKRIPVSGAIEQVRDLLRELHLATVCQSARCPNLCECFARGTATFMILGDRCTRDCGFCAVQHAPPPPLDPTEPRRVAEAVARLKLKHVVITSVTRDDIPDGGARGFRDTILAIRKQTKCTIEVLTPDFGGDADAIACVADARPEVFNHNLETVRRLYSLVRPAAEYERSLDFLAAIKRRSPNLATKSGVMVGLGETNGEMVDLMADLRRVDCDFLTIGQYLQPTPQHLEIQRFVTPAEFAEFECRGKEMGFKAIAAAPFVRSSYHAGELLTGHAAG